MPRPIHFEIHATEPERAVTFYGKLFGWRFDKWDGPMPYWLVTTGEPGTPGINGGLVKRQSAPPADGQAVSAYVCTVDVTNLDATLAAALGLGATVAVPKMPVPGVGWLAYIKDTEGNIFGMMQNDPQAK